jgi:hypothetical protein
MRRRPRATRWAIWNRGRALDLAAPGGALSLVADTLASHNSGPIRDWLAEHPRFQQAVLPVGAAWLSLNEGWWRIFRRKACAGGSLVEVDDSANVTRIATTQLNRHAQPWVWGHPPPPHRQLRRRFISCR